MKNYRTGRWLCGEPNGRGICNRKAIRPWEKWEVFKVDHKIAFRSCHGMWLCAEPPKHKTKFGGQVIANRAVAGPWELFDMMPEGEYANTPWWKSVVATAGPVSQVLTLSVAKKLKNCNTSNYFPPNSGTLLLY